MVQFSETLFVDFTLFSEKSERYGKETTRNLDN